MAERITPETALAALARTKNRYVTIFEHGKLELEFYKPFKIDPQKPHTRDEVYFVISGKGTFVHKGEKRPFGPGEVLYIPAGEPHHFEDFSEDFATWAIFAGK